MLLALLQQKDMSGTGKSFLENGTKHISDFALFNWWTSGAGPAPPLPPAGPGRSGHDVTGPEINLDFPEAQVGCEALEAIRWLWTAA